MAREDPGNEWKSFGRDGSGASHAPAPRPSRYSQAQADLERYAHLRMAWLLRSGQTHTGLSPLAQLMPARYLICLRGTSGLASAWRIASMMPVGPSSFDHLTRLVRR